MGALLTVEILRKGMPHLPAARAVEFLPHLVSSAEEFEFDVPVRLADFLAQAAHESAEFSRLAENLNYSAEGLLGTWPTRFTPALAAEVQHQPPRIAEHVYGGRGGNSPEGSGDGWLYRGRGIFQTTFRANYRAAGEVLGLPLEAAPDLLLQPQHACRSAGAFWRQNKLSPLADTGNFRAETKAINGGYTGLTQRRAYRGRFRVALGLAA